MKVRDLAEYVPARTAEGVLGILPGRVSAALGSGAGRLAWSIGVRRAVVLEQVAAAFPERPDDWVRRVADGCYRHFGREIAAIARIGRLGGASLLGMMRGGDEAVRLFRDIAGAGGALVVTGHIGNWEVAGTYLAAAGLDMAAVVKEQRNPAFDRRMLDTRRRLGIEPIYMAEARTRIPEALAEGKTVALVADQDAGRRGIFVPFLGRPASTFRGPARLALACEVPLFFGAAVREGRGYGAVLEHIAPPEPGPDAEEALTRRWVARLEARIERMPDQYFWFHRRWKTRPTGTPEP